MHLSERRTSEATGEVPLACAVHLDPVGGIAGDMFAGALLHAFPELGEQLHSLFADTDLAQVVGVRFGAHSDGILTGCKFEAAPAAHPAPQHSAEQANSSTNHNHHHEHHDEHHDGHHDDQGHHDHQHDHHRSEDHHHHSGDHAHHGHVHRSYSEVIRFIDGLDLEPGIAARARDIFTLLGRAEAEVHGIELANVAFHEVGNWDSIADILAAASLIEWCGARSWSCGPLPLGSGTASMAHGTLPVPAPATVLLLRGYPTFRDDFKGERITPTGAAILRHLQPRFEAAQGVLTLDRTGFGFGTKRFPGISNILRATSFLPADSATTATGLSSSSERHRDGPGHGQGLIEESIGIIEFEVDDQSAEDVATGIEQLSGLPQTLDVSQSASFGKKGRLGVSIRILCEHDALDATAEECFAQFTTLGVRLSVVRRLALVRENHTVTGEHEPVRVKRAKRPDGSITAKAEMDDLAQYRTHQDRQAQRARAEHAALSSDDDDAPTSQS